MNFQSVDTFHAIADSNRRQILQLLSNKSQSINSLAENFEISRPAISKHIKLLELSGFITIENVGRERHCKLKQDGFVEIQQWMDFFDTFWKGKLNKLELLMKKKMKASNYTATIVVGQEPNKVFQAIKNFRAWWSEDIEGKTDTINETFFYHYKDVHLCKIKLVEEIPNKKLVYKIIDNQFSFTKDKTEWIDTNLIFEIEKDNEKTKIKFTHEGLTPEYECFEVCNDSWGNYIKKSLYNLITTDKGEPNPKEKDGFNAEIVEKWKLK